MVLSFAATLVDRLITLKTIISRMKSVTTTLVTKTYPFESCREHHTTKIWVFFDGDSCSIFDFSWHMFQSLLITQLEKSISICCTKSFKKWVMHWFWECLQNKFIFNANIQYVFENGSLGIFSSLPSYIKM
jgi:hypothetical protein